MTANYDIITMGGGLGGAAIAHAMSTAGYRVLVVEREMQFKDRVRGEWTAPWGVNEAQKLGIFDALASGCGHQIPYWDGFAGPMAMPRRNILEDLGTAQMTFFHPNMQQTVLDAAAAAGAEVRRGVRVAGITPGPQPSVKLERDGGAETLTARLVVAADGRNSTARKWGAFSANQDPPGNWLAGVLIENVASPPEASIAVFNPALFQLALIFPQANGTVRGYFGARAGAAEHMTGDGDFRRFIDESIRTGMPADYYANARQAGPLATFDGADSWVDHPYKDGLALIGDAAASSDQTWGQGMSLTLRDVRELRDQLLASDDWDAAGHAYAEGHDGYFRELHRAEGWFTKFFMEPGPEADAVRMQGLPKLAMDPTRVPDIFQAGPEAVPADDAARRRFFGEE